MDDIRKINVYVSVVAKELLITYKRENGFARQDDALDALILDWGEMNKQRNGA